MERKEWGNLGNKKMRLRGIEPPHAAPEATALSTELQTHLCNHTLFHMKLQVFYFAEFDRRNYRNVSCILCWVLLKYTRLKIGEVLGFSKTCLDSIGENHERI